MFRKLGWVLIFWPAWVLAQPTVADVGDKRISFTLQYDVDAGAQATPVELTALVPRTIVGRQKIVNVHYSHKPAQIIDENGNRYARFILMEPGKFSIKVTVDAEIYGFNLARLRGNLRKEKPEALRRFLGEEKYLEKDAREIQEAVKGIKAGTTEIETVRHLLGFVVRLLQRGPYDEKDRGALWAIQKKRGDCTEFTDLFVALCRARGIPARVCEGYITHNMEKVDTPKHNWAEVFTTSHGWVQVDPLHVKLGLASFDRIRPYLRLSIVRDDRRLFNYHFWAYTYQGKGTVSVKDGYVIHKQENLASPGPGGSKSGIAPVSGQWSPVNVQ